MDNDPVNPFQAPVDTLAPPISEQHSNEETVTLLQQTRPWALTIGILMIISAVFMVLAAIGMIVFGSIGGGAGMPMGMAITMGVFYLVLAVFYVVPAVLLVRYSSRIAEYATAPDTAKLNAAIGTQKSFWKFCGIGALVMIGLYVLFIFVMVIVGISTSM